jgi:hypothetical protein
LCWDFQTYLRPLPTKGNGNMTWIKKTTTKTKNKKKKFPSKFAKKYPVDNIEIHRIWEVDCCIIDPVTMKKNTNKNKTNKKRNKRTYSWFLFSTNKLYANHPPPEPPRNLKMYQKNLDYIRGFYSTSFIRSFDRLGDIHIVYFTCSRVLHVFTCEFPPNRRAWFWSWCMRTQSNDENDLYLDSMTSYII